VPGSGPRSSTPESAEGGQASSRNRTFTSRRERREFEQAQSQFEQAQSQGSTTPLLPAAGPTHYEPDPFAALLGLSDAHAHQATQSDVRERDTRLDDSRRAQDPTRLHRSGAVDASTQTGRLRLRPDELARSTDSAPVPVVLPATPAPETRRADTPSTADAPAPTRRRASRKPAAAVTRPLSARHDRRPASRVESHAVARPAVKPKRVRGTDQTVRRRSPLTRLISKATIMLAAIGLVATTAVPAYAQFETPTWVDPTTGKTQTLAVGAVQTGALDRDDFAAHTISTALDSTTGTVVAPEVQALAQQLMTAVAQGRLTGSTPDHIFEIRYLAAGEAVQGCGIDYRVLQTIAFALTQFNTVGVSDINRHCTGQIEGAGTASAHYTDGGGHAVDFFRLNGHALTGGDSDSVKLIEDLDAVVPEDATVGQVGCRSGLSLRHFKQIDDTCNHLHVDFLDAKAATLLG
jgi:hypothetical protein